MDTLTRRRFLVASGMTGAVALAAGAGTVGWRELAARAGTDPLPTDSSVLVLVTLYGGNDGLGTVVPYADPAYHDARSELAYDEGEVLKLDDRLGLNPAMKGFKALWDAGRLAIVRGVGYPKPDHSHFRSMDIWQTGSPDRPVSTGWVGRWLDATGPDPLRAVSVGATLPPLAVGEKAAGVALPLTGFTAPSGDLGAGVAALARPDPADPPTQALAARSSATLLEATRALGPGLAAADEDGEDDGEAQRQGGSAGGQGQLGRQLAVVSRCIRAGVPTRVYAVSLGGFDTHANEKGTQSRLLGELDAAVSGFLSGLDGPAGGARRLLGVRPAGGGERQRRHRPRHRRPGAGRRPGRAGRLLRRPAEPDRAGRRRPAGHHGLPVGVRHAARAGAGHRGGPGARRHPARAGLPLRPAPSSEGPSATRSTRSPASSPAAR